MLLVLCIKILTLGALVWQTCNSEWYHMWSWVCVSVCRTAHNNMLEFYFQASNRYCFPEVMSKLPGSQESAPGLQTVTSGPNPSWAIPHGRFLLGFFIFYLPGTENPYISKLNHNFSLACIFYFTNTCGFHAVNILSLESLK